jgi:hypothetical protein
MGFQTFFPDLCAEARKEPKPYHSSISVFAEG